jgi:hypothetical protein
VVVVAVPVHGDYVLVQQMGLAHAGERLRARRPLAHAPPRPPSSNPCTYYRSLHVSRTGYHYPRNL